MTWWFGLIELALFMALGSVVLWVFFSPVKKENNETNSEEKHDS